MITCILLFIFVFKPSHDATLDIVASQTHVQNQETIVDPITNHACDMTKYSMASHGIFYHVTYYFHLINEYIKNIS
jgi:hypothetical protein